MNPLEVRQNISGLEALNGLTTLGGILGGILGSNNSVDIAKAQLEAQKALVQQYELQYKTKLTDAEAQKLIAENAEKERQASQKKTETILIGIVGLFTFGAILYAILRK